MSVQPTYCTFLLQQQGEGWTSLSLVEWYAGAFMAWWFLACGFGNVLEGEWMDFFE
jgi:hypothetical protein